jgi:Zn-dependent metalloprotease
MQIIILSNHLLRRCFMKRLFVFVMIIGLSLQVYGYNRFEDISLSRFESFIKNYPSANVVFKDGVRIPSFIYNISIPAENESSIRDFIINWMDFLGSDAATNSISLKRTNFFDEYSIYRYQQLFDGIEVDGGEVVALVKGSNIIQISNSLRQIDNPSYSFVYSTEAAKNIVLNHLRPSLYNEKGLSVTKAFMELGDGFYPIYKVFIESYVPVASYIYYIDARDGSIIQRINRVFTAQGQVYMDSPEKSGTPTTVTLENLTSNTYLQGRYTDVYTNCDPRYRCSDSYRKAVSSNGDFIYNPAEPNQNDPFAEVMCYYHINRAHDWYKSKGINALDFKLKAAVSVTSLGQEMGCNAAYIGGAFIVGLCLSSNPYNTKKVSVNIAYDADVMMHEYTHGFIDKTSSLYGGLDSYGLNGIPNGLNEGIADFIPSHITDDEVIGRHLSQAFGGGAVRNLNDYAKCPDNIVGESHEDGKVFASPTWLARRYLNGDDNFGKAVALAMASINSKATIQDAANAILSSAQSIGGSSMASQVQKAYEERNLLNCGRLVEVPNGYTASGWTLVPEYSGVSGKQPFVIQFVYTVPPNTNSVTVDMNAMNLQTGADATKNVTFYVNYNSYVRYSTSGTTATYKWVNSPTQTINNPQPGKYYVLAVGDGYGLYQFSFTFTYKGPPPTVASITPNSAKQGETIPEVVVKGTNFQNGSRIMLGPNTNVATTVFVDTTTLKGQNVRISANAAVGPRNVTVANPDGQQGVGAGLFTVLPASNTDAGVDTGNDAAQDTGYDTGYDTGVRDTGVVDTGYDTGIKDTGTVDTGYDSGIKDTGYDTGIVDTGYDAATKDVYPSKDVKVVDNNPPECTCDETYSCDPDCECDPECQEQQDNGVTTNGCSCSVIE